MTDENTTDGNGTDAPAAGNSTAAPGGFAEQVTDPKLGSEPGADAGSSQAEQEAAASGDGFEMPEGLYGDDGNLDPEKVKQHLATSATTQAERVEQFGEVPEGDYDLTIDVKGGDDQPLQIDPENPILKEMLPTLKAMGVGQKGVTQLLGAYAKSVLADTESIASEIQTSVLKSQQDHIAAEFASLGDEGPNRFKAMSGTIAAALGADGNPDEDGAGALLNDIRSKTAFEALERLIERASGEGGLEPLIPAGSGSKTITRANRLYPDEGKE